MADPLRMLAAREDCVLLVVDLQQRLLPHIHDHERVVANTEKLVRFARLVGIPVLCTEQEKLGDTAAAVRAALGAEAPIRKLAFGCFGCGPFREALAALGRKTLVVAGIEAHICVAQTVLEALPDHTVQVVADAVSSRTAENRRVALDRFRQVGAVVTSTEMFLYEVMRRAGTEEFRAVLPLVK